MEVNEFISFYGLERGIQDLYRKIKKLDEKMYSGHTNDILYETGDILVAEQCRILAQHPVYSKLQPLIRRWTKETRYGRHLYVGYPSFIVKEHIEVMIIEFGRPGSHFAGGKNIEQKDKIGRKIGAVQPYSHIRAAWALKKDVVYAFMKKRIIEEAKKIWEEE